MEEVQGSSPCSSTNKIIPLQRDFFIPIPRVESLKPLSIKQMSYNLVMEKSKSIDEQYQEKFGINEKLRNERLQEMLAELQDLLIDGGFQVVSTPDQISEKEVCVNGRVKSLDRLKEKLGRLGYAFDDNYDGWGMEVVVDGQEDEEKIVGLIEEEFEDEPTGSDLTRSNGSRMPKTIISGPQTSEESHPEYRAVTIFKKGPYGITSTRVIRKDIYLRTQDPEDPLYHGKYKERQAEIKG